MMEASSLIFFKRVKKKKKEQETGALTFHLTHLVQHKFLCLIGMQ